MLGRGGHPLLPSQAELGVASIDSWILVLNVTLPGICGANALLADSFISVVFQLLRLTNLACIYGVVWQSPFYLS